MATRLLNLCGFAYSSFDEAVRLPCYWKYRQKRSCIIRPIETDSNGIRYTCIIEFIFRLFMIIDNTVLKGTVSLESERTSILASSIVAILSLSWILPSGGGIYR